MSEKLETLLVGIQVDLANLKKEMDRAKSYTLGLQQSIETHTKQSGKAFDQMQSALGESVRKQSAHIESIKMQYVKMAAAATAAFFAVKKAWSMAENAASLEEQKGALEILGRQYGQTADQIIAAVTAASGAQLSLRDSTMLATKALQAGFAPDQVAKLVRGAEMIADRTGEDIPAAFEKLTRAVKTGQERTIAMYFSNLKLTSSLEGEEDAIGATTVQGENYLRVADQIDEMQRQMAGSTESTADQMGRFKADMDDLVKMLEGGALRALAGVAASVMGLKSAFDAASLSSSKFVEQMARIGKFNATYNPFAKVGQMLGIGLSKEQFAAIQEGASSDALAAASAGSQSSSAASRFLDIMLNGPSSGTAGVPRSNVRATGTDYLNILKNWRKKRPATGGGGGSTSSAASPADKVGDYLGQLRTNAAEIGMTEYEVGLSRVIARLQELGATETQIAQGKAIFAAGFEKKKMLEEMGDAAEYAKKATSELAASFVELEGKYSMIAAETEAARAEYQKQAIDPLAGIFGELDSSRGMNPKDTEADRTAQIESYRKEAEAVISSLSPYIAYVKQLEKIKALRDKGIVSPEQSYIMEESAAMTREAADSTAQYTGTLEERAKLEQILGYAVRANVIDSRDASAALIMYEQALGRMNDALPLTIKTFGGLSEGFGQAFEDWGKGFDLFKDVQKTVQDVADGVTGAFTDMIANGKSLAESMTGVANAVVNDLVRMMVQLTITQPIMGALQGALTGAGWITPPAARAGGGFVQASMPYIVGEKGPELFVPSGAGTVIPNDRLASAGGLSSSVTVNIHPDISGNVRAQIMNAVPHIVKAAQAGVADAKMRGGQFAAAMG